MRELERRIGKLENEKSVDEHFQLVVVDEELPDGTLIHNGVPVVLKPATYSLIIHRHRQRN
jgi:hypothetical protein